MKGKNWEEKLRKPDITEHKRAVEALCEHEGRYRDLIEHSRAAFYRMNIRTGEYEYVSPYIEKLTGYSPQEAYDNPMLVQKGIHPDFAEYFKENWGKLQEGIVPETFEYKIIHKNGEERWLFQGNVGVYDDQGKLVAIEGIIFDITERKQAEETLKKSEEKFQYIIDNTWDIIFHIDLKGNYTFANKTAERVTGYSLDELLGMNMRELIAPEYQQSIFGRLKKRIAGEPLEQPFDFEIVHKDGHRITVELTTTPIYGDDGKLIGIQGIARGVTERKRVEEALQESEEKYRATFEHTGTAMAIIEEDTTISLVNSQFEKLSGYSKEEVEGKMSWTKFVHPDDLERMIEYHKKRREKPGKVLKEYEFRGIDKNGNILNAFINVDLIPGTKKTVTSLIDITKRKKMEEKIAEQEKMAALGRIAAVVAHELNTPLANIGLTAEYLSSKIQKGYTGELQTIKSEVTHASDIIKRALGFSRMEDIEIKQVNLKEIVTRAADTVRKTCDTTGVDIKTQLSSPCPMKGDEYRLREAFINIIKNAVEATDSKKEIHRVDVNSIMDDDSVTVTIVDSGVGMDKQTQEKVLKPFFTTKSPDEGTGLGLFIAQWIIQKHGGNISISSEKQKGTTVAVTLPIGV